MILQKIGFGGGCHWCTEAYFQSLTGVDKVEQGWISSTAPDDTFSEAVIVYYNPAIIPLKILIAVHLHTHAATKNHSFRKKYFHCFLNNNSVAPRRLT
jgi:peptide-methionine (S)-S-oxide reductase